MKKIDMRSGLLKDVVGPDSHDGFLGIFLVEVPKTLDTVIHKTSTELISIHEIQRPKTMLPIFIKLTLILTPQPIVILIEILVVYLYHLILNLFFLLDVVKNSEPMKLVLFPTSTVKYFPT